MPHVAGEPHSCQIRQVGTVMFNPRKQVRVFCMLLGSSGLRFYATPEGFGRRGGVGAVSC